ncbi:MAG TPA: hypothetical protein VKQ28_04980 [Candidatus Acidoferrum sp.]|nr:hypothetical protein [Candidatus Acidoferrum sp.]
MLCDKYKEALMEAAADGAALPSSLREHVEACALCGARLAAERTLFAAVDAGLHEAANAKVHSSFLVNVKANLATETIPARNPIPGWAFVCATAAIALAAVFLSLPRDAHNQARTEAITFSNRVPTGAGGVELSLAPERKTRYSAKAIGAPEKQNLAGNANHEPEVLIQPEEEEFLKRFYAAGRSQTGDARAVVTEDHEVPPRPLVIEQIEVRDLKIENLDEESGLAQTGTK